MWELIKSNRRKSIIIFIGMGLLLILLGFLIGTAYIGDEGGFVGIFFAIILWTILSSISYFAGSSILLSVSKAKEVTQSVHPQLFNVVEEMKIASALPYMPKIYIINEEAPNAFATGIKPEKSAIAVTSGLLSRLNRDELQGVIAHEMAHIVNRDVLLMTFAGVMLGSIVIISEVFLRSLWLGGGKRYSSKSKSSGQAQLIIMIVALVFAILAPIIARLLYFAISRKREYLADASAVRFTRYPEGLASALEKISSSNIELPSANKVTAPMYIINPLKKKGMKLSDLTSTHPPISERIRILRNLGGNIDYRSYQNAFNKVHGGTSKIIPDSAITGDTMPLMAIAPVASEQKFDYKENKRTVGDAVMKLNGYSIINCSCGMKLKLPPGFGSNKPQIICPRCKTVHKISQAV
ncbi:MAG: M48 family metallopeptidase [Ignavibacteriales bacterium]|nr:MAG: M48 family metallopeptidase [Ignavibacteriales bacterium]